MGSAVVSSNAHAATAHSLRRLLEQPLKATAPRSYFPTLNRERQREGEAFKELKKGDDL